MTYFTIRQAGLSVTYATKGKKKFRKKIDKKCLTTKLQKSRRRSHAIFADTKTRRRYAGPAGMMPAGMGTPGLQTAKRTRYGLQGAPGPSPPTGVRPRHYQEWKEVSLSAYPGSLWESKSLDQYGIYAVIRPPKSQSNGPSTTISSSIRAGDSGPG